jgi:hypothetical protein
MPGLQIAGFHGSEGTGCGCCGGGTGFACGSCTIPAADLTLSWSGFLPGSTTLFYDGPTHTWTSACTGIPGLGNTLWTLSCLPGNVVQLVGEFVSSDGTCSDPAGSCASNSGAPFLLTNTGLTCGDSFLATYTVDDCDIFADNGTGITGLTISS